MKNSCVCPQCDSNLYGVASVYIGEDDNGELSMQELDDTEVAIRCDNDDCSINKTSASLPGVEERMVGFLVRANRAYSAMTEIATLMNGTEWNSDTLNDIADVVRESGFELEDVGLDK
jgi:hypothetical protein